jgi:hypothetical protein
MPHSEDKHRDFFSHEKAQKTSAFVGSDYGGQAKKN